MDTAPQNYQPLRLDSLGLWLVVLFLAYGLWPLCACVAQGHGPTRVEVATVSQQDTAPTIRLVGTVRPRLRTVLAAEVSGLTAELPVDEGDLVKKGHLLCKLRDDQRRFAHAEAVAQQAVLTAGLAVRTAEHAKARFERERTTRLSEQDRCTEKEWRDAVADSEAALARVEEARHAVEAQKAVVRALADDLARTEIRSPCDGHIVAKRTEIGSWVKEGGEIVELVDLSTARVRVSVPESVIAFCLVGEDVQVFAEAIGKDYSGKVSRVIPDADERARTFPVEIDIPNSAGVLKAGMFIRAAVPSGPKAKRLVVPKDAVTIRGSMSMVYVIQSSGDGQMAMPMPVEIVSEIVDSVAIQGAGLAAGAQVVVRGNEFMFGPTPVIVLGSGRPGEAAGGNHQHPPEAGDAAMQPHRGADEGSSTHEE